MPEAPAPEHARCGQGFKHTLQFAQCDACMPVRFPTIANPCAVHPSPRTRPKRMPAVLTCRLPFLHQIRAAQGIWRLGNSATLHYRFNPEPVQGLYVNELSVTPVHTLETPKCTARLPLPGLSHIAPLSTFSSMHTGPLNACLHCITF